MSVSIARFVEIAPLVLDRGYPVLIRGLHGIGKSQSIYQLAKKLGLPVVERRAAQMTEGDMIGLPSPDVSDGTTKFLPPDWLKRACNEAVALFFDEVDRAQNEVRMGIFQILDSREFYGNKLHPGTRVFAAINGGTQGAVGSQYLVQSFCPAEIDRWVIFDIEPTIEEWKDWAKDKFDAFTWNFINEHPQHIEYRDTFEPHKIYPSRRSWDRLNDTLKAAGLLDEPKDHALDIFTLAHAFVGLEAAVQLQTFANAFSKSVKVSDIIDAGKFDLLEGFNATQHAEFIDKMDFEGIFKDAQLSSVRQQNLAYYFGRIPSEHAGVIWHKFAGVDNTQMLRNLWPLECDPKTHENVKERMTRYLTANPEALTPKKEETEKSAE